MSVAAQMVETMDDDAIPADALLAARGLSRRFGKRIALNDVSLTLRPGRVVGLLGANGAGKSTLLSLLAGHLLPTSGQVIWGGAARADATRGRLGMLPQGAPLPPAETPRRILTQLARLQHAPDPAGAAAEILVAVGLEVRADERLRTLSEGERKLVAIGQAFLGQPEVILLDEPTAALDPWGRRHLRALVRARRDTGAAVMLSSHNLPEAEQLCDEAIVLRQGCIQSSGALTDLLGASDQVRFEIGRAGRLPIESLRRVLPNVDAHFEPETRTLTLASLRSPEQMDQVVAITFRLLGEVGAEVRRVVYGRSLEGALTALTTTEHEPDGLGPNVADSREERGS